MTDARIHTLSQRLSSLMRDTKRQSIREQTRQALEALGPALRDDIGLTRHRQLISFQNEMHQKHSFD